MWNRELRDSRAQIGRQQALETQPHFQANHAVLNRERESARVKKYEHERGGEQDVHDGSKGDPVFQLDEPPHKIHQEHAENVHVVGRNDSDVILKRLYFSLCHLTDSFPPAR